MTQNRKSTRNKSLNSHRSLSAQSLCWLGSFSILSSGFVYAQTESAIDNIVPAPQNVKPVNVRKAAPVRKTQVNVSAPESSNSQTKFSSRRARLRERLNQKASTRAKKAGARLRERLANRARKRPQNNASSRNTGRVRPQTARKAPSQEAVVIRKPNQTSAANNLRLRLQSNTSNRSVGVNSSRKNPVRDYNSAYLDPTDYKLKPSATQSSPANTPNTVVVRSRSGQCRVVGSNSVNLCSPINGVAKGNSNSQNTRVAAKRRPSTPSWIRKSENVRIAAVPNRPINPSRSSRRQIAPSRPLPVTRATSSIRPKQQSVAKPNLNSNRFIPAPNSFIPQSIQTTVNSAAIAPQAGMLPPPITANFTAPRPSAVTYDIPLASTLPQIARTGTGPLAINTTGILFPVFGPARITSLFGWRTHPISGDRRFHTGTDIGAAQGTPIVAAATGKVEIADYVGGYGLTVVLNHNNAQQTLYGHMAEVFVQPGQWIEQGTPIGLVGSTGNSTGPHLHFEVRQLTPNGWVAVDADTQIQYALQQMTLLRTAQAQQAQASPSSNP